ncbi:class I SAM-dependent methyltransferase [Elongatibacter sediminis]|uniref:Class I SAM-dependent methyltransferase n=1 Tax=Elongatibacter sediminis TaxID=3119006 RepID=A0AAW9R6H6_9GAMM
MGKIRDSGMPEASTWDGFFAPERILDALNCRDLEHDIVDFGCGYGTFTLAAARRTAGTVHALDIEADMIDRVRDRAGVEGLANIRTECRDFIRNGTGLADASCDYAMLFNILHAEAPLELLREAARLLRPGGRIGIVHWVHDRPTPRGPDPAIRPRPDQCCAWLEACGLSTEVPGLPLPPHHFGVVGRRAPITR